MSAINHTANPSAHYTSVNAQTYLRIGCGIAWIQVINGSGVIRLRGGSISNTAAYYTSLVCNTESINGIVVKVSGIVTECSHCPTTVITKHCTRAYSHAGR